MSRSVSFTIRFGNAILEKSLSRDVDKQTKLLRIKPVRT